MRTYESVIVIDSLLKSEEIDAIVEKVERIIKNNGGEILEVDRWGKKRLAYEIKKRQYGYYVDFIFKSPGNLVYILEREYNLDENILRFLTVHLNKRALQYKEQQKAQMSKAKPSAAVDETQKAPVESKETGDQPAQEEKESAEVVVETAEDAVESSEQEKSDA